LGIEDIFWPLTHAVAPMQRFTGWLDSVLMIIFIIGVLLVTADAVRRWVKTAKGAPIPEEAWGPPLTKEGEVKMGCC
jgi:hypothetical protein